NNKWISTEDFMEHKYTKDNKCKLKSTTSKKENNELSELKVELLSLNKQKNSKKSLGKLVIKKEDEMLKIKEFTIKEKYQNNEYNELNELKVELLNIKKKKNSKKSLSKLVIKKEDEMLKINEFTIQEKYRNNGYSIEMFKEAIKGIETNKTEAVALFGDVSSVITKGSNKVIDIQENGNHEELKAFFENIGFEFKTNTKFEKNIENVDIHMWNQLLNVRINNKKLENIIMDLHEDNQSYIELKNFLHNNILGRFVLKLYRKI